MIYSDQHGLCRALSYIVQTLSAEPSFGARLAKPVKAQLPSKWNAPGTAADFFINACCLLFHSAQLTFSVGGLCHSCYDFGAIDFAVSCTRYRTL